MEKVGGRLKWNQKLSLFVLSKIELFFYRLGRTVALKPKTTIVVTLLIALLSCVGFLRFHQEKNPLKLWVPRKSSFVENSEWLMRTFEKGYRVEATILEATDVLTPEIFKKLARIDDEIKTISSPRGHRYKDLCLKIPKISPTNELVNKIEFSCDILDFLEEGCLEQNILELWDYRYQELDNLTKEDILRRINKYKRHPIFSNLIIYEDLLGGIVRNQSGDIISASHIHTQWLLKVNFSAIDTTKAGNSAGTAEFASEESLLWELTYLERMKDIKRQIENVTMFYTSARSFGDISGATMFQDYDILFLGVVIVTIYIQLVISRYNWIEGRLLVTFFGFSTIALAFIVGCSLAFTIGMSCGPVHTSLPFLLLGIGIDDIFVILSCLDQLTNEQKKLPIHERFGTMLQHAGVSISITSFTDVAAFLIGSTTVLPSLQSYCLFAAFSLAFTYLFTCTFFVACLTFDDRRQADNRNCCLPCIKHPDYKKNDCSQRDYTKKALEIIYSRVILTWPGKLLILLIVAILSGISVQGVINLEQKFDPLWFIPSHTHLSQYASERSKMYPFLGYDATLYMGSINYTHEFKNINALSKTLEGYTDIVYSLNSWVDEYQKFVFDRSKKDIYDVILAEEDFQRYLGDFLFRNGSKFQHNFKFASELKCGQPAPKIEVAGIDFRFLQFTGPKQHVPAMRKVSDLAERNNFTTGDRRSFVWSISFSAWIPDEIIDVEMTRNLILALVCVMSCTVILIVDFHTCFWIFVCVLITMLNVAGFMQFWGITIDVTSCIALQLAIGLCVDYATHIGYTFLTIADDDRNKRSLKTVATIGTAVLYGGVSTLIAILLLSISEAYAFQIFFKLFLMVTTFGLFNGLVFLPVILSWLGPPPYKMHQPLPQNDVGLY